MKTPSWLLSFASIVVILAGLKSASSIVVPFLLAVFIAITISPAVVFVQKLKIPRVFSFIIVSVFVLGTLIYFGNIVISAISSFSHDLPSFQAKLNDAMQTYLNKLHLKINISNYGINPDAFLEKASGILKQTGKILSTSFFIFILIAFMIFETNIIEEKVRYFSKINSLANVFVIDFISNLKRYLLIKTLASGATGFLIYLGLLSLNIPYASLWGLSAFILNYIPTIGSIVAAIPTIFITLATSDLNTTFWVVGIYIFVNVAIGNIIEPRFLGEQLGISTIVVLASLLLWGFIFGIGGLFLAIPLTMSIKIALNSNPKTRFIATILSNKLEN